MSIQATPLQIAVRAIVHHAASELARLGVDAPDSEVADVAIIEAIGMRVYLGVTKVEPAKLHLTEEGRRRLGIQGDQPPSCSPLAAQPENQDGTQKTPSKTPGWSPCPHRRVHREILRVAPDKVPVTVARLAKMARYSYSSFFRTAVSDLLRDGGLVRVSGGIVKGKIAGDKVT